MMRRLAQAICAALIRTGSVFVPHEERAEWIAEWHAEVESSWTADAPRGDLRVVRRCFGALLDGASFAWLRSSPGFAFDTVATAAQEAARAPWRLAAAVVGATLCLAIAGTLLAWLGEEWNRGGLSRTTNLVVLHNRWEAGRGTSFFPFSIPEFETLRAHAARIPSMGAHSLSTSRWTSPDGESSAATVARASGNLFDVVGMRMVRGRPFTMADEAHDADRVVVVSSNFWKSRLHADRHAVGRTALVGGEPHVIVGVAADSPRILPPVDLWVPLAHDPSNPGPPNARDLRLVGRIAPGVQVPLAQSEVAALLAGIPIPGGADPPESFDRVAVEAWGARRRERDLARCAALLGALLILALITRCAASSATGGSRADRLARAVTLLLPATAGALLLSRFARDVSTTWLDARPPSGAAIALALLAVLAWPLVDAVRGAMSVGPSRRDRRTAVWVGGALAVAAAALFFRGAAPALRATGLPSARIALLNVRFETREGEPIAGLSRRVLERMAALPGVQGVGLATATPFGRAAGSASVSVADRIEASPPDVSPVRLHEADYHFVDATFFESMGIPTRGSRRLAPGEVIVNETLARDLNIEQTAIGRSLRIPARERLFTIVGVVPDLLLRDPTLAAAPEVFFSLGGTEGSSVPVPNWGTLWVRSDGAAGATSRAAVQAALGDLGADVTVSQAWSLRDARWTQLTERSREWIAGAVALGLGLSLAVLAGGPRRALNVPMV